MYFVLFVEIFRNDDNDVLQVEELQSQHNILLTNISTIFTTAQRELKRKQADIDELERGGRR